MKYNEISREETERDFGNVSSLRHAVRFPCWLKLELNAAVSRVATTGTDAQLNGLLGGPSLTCRGSLVFFIVF
jgi:hypothetical protein